MTHETAQDLITRLDMLLEAERRALLEGDLTAIALLLKRKEALIDAFGALAPQTRTDISALQGKVMRNQALLDGALEGIRKVAGRMAAIRRIRHTLDTYDDSGRKSSISGVIDHKVEKRA